MDACMHGCMDACMHGWIIGGMKRDKMTQEKNGKKRRIGKKGGQQTDQCRIGGKREMQGRCVAGRGQGEVSEGGSAESTSLEAWT